LQQRPRRFLCARRFKFPTARTVNHAQRQYRARVPKALRLTRRSHKPASSCTMAESIPKAKSAYAFFQAAMNKQMVGVPLG